MKEPYNSFNNFLLTDVENLSNLVPEIVVHLDNETYSIVTEDYYPNELNVPNDNIKKLELLIKIATYISKLHNYNLVHGNIKLSNFKTKKGKEEEEIIINNFSKSFYTSHDISPYYGNEDKIKIKIIDNFTKEEYGNYLCLPKPSELSLKDIDVYSFGVMLNDFIDQGLILPTGTLSLKDKLENLRDICTEQNESRPLIDFIINKLNEYKEEEKEEEELEQGVASF